MDLFQKIGPIKTKVLTAVMNNLFIVSFVKDFLYHIRLSFLAVMASIAIIFLWPTTMIENSVHWHIFGGVVDSNIFFHLFHFPHITFACATSMLAIYRGTHNLLLAIVASCIFPVMFCTLSDVILPYAGGEVLGVDMLLHICITCSPVALLSFLSVGLLSGYLLIKYSQTSRIYHLTLVAHFFHELFSGIASLAYIAGFGLADWNNHLLSVLILILFAVILPCMLSDFFMPLLIQKLLGKKHGNKIQCCLGKD